MFVCWKLNKPLAVLLVNVVTYHISLFGGKQEKDWNKYINRFLINWDT